MMLNAQSIRSKFDELQCYVASEKPDIICITETWVNEGYFGDNMKDFEISGFNMFACEREANRKGGGIVVYINSLFSTKVVADDRKDTRVESVWVDVKLGSGNKKQLRIGTFYRPGTLASEQQLDLDKAICDEIGRNYCRQSLILGDFNLKDFERPEEGSPSCRIFRQCLEEDLFMYQFVDRPTRKEALLDLVFSDVADLVQDLEVGETLGSSDHNIVRFKIKAISQVKDNPTMVPNFNRADFDSIRQALKVIDWEEEFRTLDAFSMWEKFKSFLSEVQARFVPLKQKRKRKSLKPVWLTPDVKQAIRAKKDAFRLLKENSTENNFSKYKMARDKAKSLIRSTKRSKEIDLARNCNGDCKKFFSYYKLSKVASSIGPLEVNGSVIDHDVDIVEALSEQFKTVFTVEDITRIPEIDGHRLSNVELTDIGLVDKDMVLKHIGKIRPNKAEGPDEISARLLRETEKEISIPLAIIFRRSIEHIEIPTDWKRANVVPIFKKGDKGKVENYRPVSLTSLVCKLLESMIKDEVVSFLESQKLINETQHGFRKGRSCLTNLLEFLDFVTEQYDKGNQVDTAYLDFSKAFDTVPHKRLITQLQRHGVTGPLKKWIEEWLTERKQRVMLNGTKSSWQDVLSGVPQGSVLGPLLFIIYVNCIEDGIHSKVLKFADDLKVFRSVRKSTDQEALQSDLDTLVRWSEEWQMNFNVSKCKVMSLGKRKFSGLYKMGGQVLAEITQEKDLGVLVSSSLKVADQCREARKKGLRMLGSINRNVGYKSEMVIKKLYTAYVRPHLEYCIQSWSPTYEKDGWLLERVQKRATKMVNGLHGLSYDERLRKLDMFSLKYRRLRGDLIEVFKCLQGQEKGYLKDMFEFKRTRYATRGHQHQIKLGHSRTRLRQSFFTNRVVQHWNKLPEDIVSSESLNIFKKNVDIHFKQNGIAFKYS